MSQRNVIHGIIAALCLLIAFLFIRMRDNREVASVRNHHNADKIRKSNRDGSASIYERLISSESTDEGILDLLKSAWVQYAPTDAHEDLVKITVDRLGCSLDMVNLLQFLSNDSDPHVRMGYRLLSEEIRSRLERGYVEMRNQVVSLPSVGVLRDSPKYYKVRWAEFAGFGCDLDAFSRFHSSIDDSQAARSAAFGQALRISDQDPYSALALAVKNLGENGETYRMEGGATDGTERIFSQIIENAQSDLDIAKLISLLPLDHRSKSKGLVDGFSSAIEKWSKTDFDAANRFVLDHHNFLASDVIGPLVWANIETSGIAVDFDWWKSLPQGELFDSAMRERTMYMQAGFSDEAPLPGNTEDKLIALKEMNDLKKLSSSIKSEWIREEVTMKIDSRIEQLQQVIND
jgi:hypothetical protein